jgi:hypothetical protein
MNKEEITGIKVVCTMVHVTLLITLVRHAHILHNNFQNSSRSMYITQKEEICVKFDLGEFYKKLYSYFNLQENQMILKSLNEDFPSR